MSTNVLRAPACAMASPPPSLSRSRRLPRLKLALVIGWHYSAETGHGEIGDAVGDVPHANVVVASCGSVWRNAGPLSVRFRGGGRGRRFRFLEAGLELLCRARHRRGLRLRLAAEVAPDLAFRAFGCGGRIHARCGDQHGSGETCGYEAAH